MRGANLLTRAIVAACASLLAAGGFTWLDPSPHGRLRSCEVCLRVQHRAIEVIEQCELESDGHTDWLPDLYFHHPPGTVQALRVAGWLGERPIRPLQVRAGALQVRVTYAPLPPGSNLVVQCQWTQPHLGAGGLFLSSLLQRWTPPPERLAMRIELPRALKLSQCTLPVAEHTDEAERRVYRLRVDGRTLDRDLMFHWVHVPKES